MKRHNSGKDGSPPRTWKRMLVVVAAKTDVIVNAYRRRSDDEWCVWRERMKVVKS